MALFPSHALYPTWLDAPALWERRLGSLSALLPSDFVFRGP